MSLTVSTVRDQAGLEELRPHWDRLAGQGGTPWGYHGWTAHVHHHVMRADGSIPHVAVARTASGQIVGLIPTAIGTMRHGPLTLQVLRPLAQQTWPDFALLVDPAHDDDAPPALHGWLSRTAREVDRVDLRFIRNADGPLAAPAGPLEFGVTPVPTFRVTFPEGTSEWPALLGRHARQAIRNQERRLTADHAATMTTLHDPAAIDRWIGPFQSLHTDRARLLGRDLLFEIGTTGRDFGPMLRLLVAAGAAEFHVLTTGDRLIAGQVTFRAGPTTHDYRRAFDDEFAKYGPGSVLQAAVMQRSLDRGDRHFDFGLGSGAHKSRWATRSEPTFRLHHAHGVRHAALACYTRLARMRNRWRPADRKRPQVETSS